MVLVSGELDFYTYNGFPEAKRITIEHNFLDIDLEFFTGMTEVGTIGIYSNELVLRSTSNIRYILLQIVHTHEAVNPTFTTF